MGSKGKVKLDADLLARAREVARAGGYSSVEEFIAHVLERELGRVADAAGEAELRERLKGLGYIS